MVLYETNFGWAGGFCPEQLISDGNVEVEGGGRFDGEVEQDIAWDTRWGLTIEVEKVDGNDDDCIDVNCKNDIDEDEDADSNGLSGEQQTISSKSAVWKDWSIVEVEVVSFFFFSKDERKEEWIIFRFGSLSLHISNN